MKDLLHWKPYALRLRARFLLGVPDISREFAGKTVALVGNARSLGATRMGEAIDRCDIVVRFNQCPMVGEPSHGRRTDWIALSTYLSRQRYLELGARGVLWFSSRRRKMPAWLAFERRLYVNPREMTRKALRSIEGRPSTGLMMIHLLSTLDVHEARLYGFDFFKSRSFSGEHTAETAPHDFSNEERLVHELMRRDERFVLCGEQ